MNLADPELELIDPTPNVHLLFIQFDKIFFWAKLCSRATVRWSKKMYSCAGICSYEGRGGLCDIALSEPLLKLRPRKNLVETLLHEMIHAFLFVTGNDRDRDGHGPNFQSHMYRINKAAHVDISIYHDFHDEVKLYRTHVWRCDGPCQQWKPYFGIVRRPNNRAPGPSDRWWNDHMRRCSGKFIKTNEPEKAVNKKTKSKKPMGDITKYVNNNNTKDVENKNIPTSSFTNGNGGSTVILSQRTSNVKKTSPKSTVTNHPKANKPIPIFDGKGQTVGGSEIVKTNDNVKDTVRDVWSKKQQLINTKMLEDISHQVREIWANKVISGSSSNFNNSTRKHTSTAKLTPPKAKVKKIDDYFKSVSDLLEDVYGKDSGIKPECVIKKPINNNKTDLVDCPICAAKVKSTDINQHIDECLNKDVIEKICKTEDIMISPSSSKLIISRETDNLVSPKNEIPIASIDLTVLHQPIITTTNYHQHQTNSKATITSEVNKTNTSNTIIVDEVKSFVNNLNDTDKKTDPEQSKNDHKCPCCELKINKSMEDHFDECLAFFNNNDTIPEEGASTSFASIVIDDDEDDILDESLTMNATGTKTPCPVCLTMVEQDGMNNHLDICLSS